MTHGATMCLLAIASFVSQSLQMHRVTKGWQLNQYMNLLAKQGILYFVGYVPTSVSSALTTTFRHSIFLYNLVVVFNYSGGVWQGILLYVLAYVPI